MDPKISFLMSTSKNYAGVQRQLIDLIAPHLPEGSWVETLREPDHAKLNIAFFISRHAHILMSHGVADKNYFTRKDDTGKRILNRFQYGFVPGNWLRNKLIKHSAIEMPAENIHIVGWPRLDVLTKLRAERPPSDRLRVLWAPTHNHQNRNGRVLSSFPDFEQYLPALSEHFDVTASPHPRNRPDKTPTTEKMAHCDVLISDFGTTVYEALALGIPVIFPDWLIRDGITSVFSKSSPAQLFKQNIGYHPKNFDEMMDILKAGPVIDEKTKAFIDNVIDPATVGRSGEITARKLVELAQRPLMTLPSARQTEEEDLPEQEESRTLLYYKTERVGLRVYKELKNRHDFTGLVVATKTYNAAKFDNLPVIPLEDYKARDDDQVILGVRQWKVDKSVAALAKQGLDKDSVILPSTTEMKKGTTFENPVMYDLGLHYMKWLNRHLAGTGLRYYAFAGTLLGLARHGNFIPWDNDIDIAVPFEEFDTVMEKLGAQYDDLRTASGSKVKAKLKKYRFNNGPWRKGQPRRIFMSCKRDGVTLRAAIVPLYRNGDLMEYKSIGRVFPQPAAHFDGMAHLDLAGEPFPVPLEHEALLSTMYGDWKQEKKDFTYFEYTNSQQKSTARDVAEKTER